MAFSLDDIAQDLVRSRRHFQRHLDGLTPEQWDWKPYPECKSVRETVLHLLWVDTAGLESMQSGENPSYWHLDIAESDPDRLRELLIASHARIVEHLRSRFDGSPLDTEISLWGSPRKLGSGVAYLSAEDFYHAGQVAFIRMATDPGWDYYGFVYAAD